MAVHYDRLSQLDNSFLVYETPQAAMHVASTQVHEAAPLQRSDGSLADHEITRGIDHVMTFTGQAFEVRGLHGTPVQREFDPVAHRDAP